MVIFKRLYLLEKKRKNSRRLLSFMEIVQLTDYWNYL